MRIRRPIEFQSIEELSIVERQAKAAGLSLSNFIRKTLKLPKLTKGGAQPRTDLYCGDCWRRDRSKVVLWKDGLCSGCWHAQADAKSAI